MGDAFRGPTCVCAILACLSCGKTSGTDDTSLPDASSEDAANSAGASNRDSVLSTPCGGFNAFVQGGVDTAQWWFFDAASGALVAVAGVSMLGPSCVAGVGSVPAACFQATTFATCPLDAGIVDAGGD